LPAGKSLLVRAFRLHNGWIYRNDLFTFCLLSGANLIRLSRMKHVKSLKKASGGLVGAIAIAGGTSAYADVVSVAVPPDSTIPAGPGDSSTLIDWDVNGDSIVDFVFRNRYPEAGGTGVQWQINMRNPAGSGNAILGYGGFPYGSAFSSGTVIGSAAPTGTSWQTAAQVIMASDFDGVLYGGFANPSAPGTGSVNPGTPSYAGFRFNVGANTFYGWIQFSASPGHIDFISAAYNTTPNAPVTAGVSVVPEPSTLAALAMGATMLGGIAWRRKRQTAA
jgi:hypothetical protein